MSIEIGAYTQLSDYRKHSKGVRMHRSSVQVEFVLADSTYERPANDCSTHFDPAVRSYDLPIHSTVGDWWWRSIPCT